MPKTNNEDESSRPVDQVVSQLLFNRGLVGKTEINNFLSPNLEKDFFDPFLFKNMAAAVDLIIKNIKEENKITIYGDYDADGVTATATMYETLNILKAKTDIYIPERVSEGYGLNSAAIKEIKEAGSKLIITVDSGIRNQAEAALAASLGLELIITDHHVPPDAESLPVCLIISAQLPGSGYPEKNLSGVGVAFKLASALISRTKLSDDEKDILKNRLYDLAAVGTVADCVPLLGENRLLVKKGLAALNFTKRLGLRELIKAAQIKQSHNLDSWNIGFQIAPRINAAGRLDHANTAFQLLITKDAAEARDLARDLNDRNIERQRITAEIMDEVEKRINNKDKILIGLCEDDKGWNEGVVGLVAGKICEKYYRPTLVITKSGDEYKGSGRSIPEINIIKAIEESKDILERYGGHAAACGFSFKEKNLDKFIKRINQTVERELGDILLVPRILIDTEIDLANIDDVLISELDKFRPFGQSNERPKFSSFGVKIVNIITMGAGKEHIKLMLQQDNSSIFNAIGFGQAEKWSDLKIGGLIDIVYFIDINEYNGRREIQLKIIDIKKNDKSKE